MTSTTSRTTRITKELWILRHGQAMHNVRAEIARAGGCTFDKFFQLMKEDDSLDCPLTELGKQQAQSVHEQYFRQTATTTPPLVTPSTSSVPGSSIASSLSSSIALKDDNNTILRHYPNIVISSPLSRAVQTADIVLPNVTQRIIYEGFREVNGCLLNAQRRTKSELQTLFPHWDWDYIETENDVLWDPNTLETHQDCANRGLQALEWLCQLQTDTNDKNNEQQQQHHQDKEQQRILLVAHGGLLRYIMELSEHNNKQLFDASNSDITQDQHQKQQQQQETIDDTSCNNNSNNLPKLIVQDGRKFINNSNNHHDTNDSNKNTVTQNDSINDHHNVSVVRRFENCELRKYNLEYCSIDPSNGNDQQQQQQRTIILTELDL